MVQLPTELWLMIFDILIEEGIIQCDHTTFPYIQNSLISQTHGRQFNHFYYRLRLVCRRFNTLLGARPWQSFSDSSLLPFPVTTRALYLDLEALSKPAFQCLLAETSTCGRLVYLDVTCSISPSSDRLSLSDFLCAGPTFRHVQRLTLQFINGPFRNRKQEVSFWPRLNCAFPLLTTFVMVTQSWNASALLQLGQGDEVVCFERLETLYFSGKVSYSRCQFPRLRNASIWICSQNELQVLIRSPDLESLLIRSHWVGRSIDVSSCPHLKLLGFPHRRSVGVVPLGCDHPVEHIWLYSNRHLGDPQLITQLSRRLPKISRITVEFIPSSSQENRRQITDEFREMKLDSFGLTMRPGALGDSHLILERATV